MGSLRLRVIEIPYFNGNRPDRSAFEIALRDLRHERESLEKSKTIITVIKTPIKYIAEMFEDVQHYK